MAPDRAVATYSICACDLEHGRWGVATQSKFLAVGSVVPWAAAHVGAIATQSYANPRYGPDGLDLLRAGHEQFVAALGRALEGTGFAPAQRGVDGGEASAGLRPERLDQARAVQRHRLVAVADQGRHREVVSVR